MIGRYVLALVCASILGAGRGGAQDTVVDRQTGTVHAHELALLQRTGERVIDALKSGDAAFLALIVDDAGIAIGIDGPITTGVEFREELRAKRAAYCDLLGCAGTTTSVRQMLIGRKLSVIARLPTSSDVGQVDVFDAAEMERAGPKKGPLLTLFFAFCNGAWRLGSIDYI